MHLPLMQVYDARALRVIVEDEGGARLGDAVEVGERAMWLRARHLDIPPGCPIQTCIQPAFKPRLLPPPAQACYQIVALVHSVWKAIPHEFDDYIANPKPSGYQALHTGGSHLTLELRQSPSQSLTLTCVKVPLTPGFVPPECSSEILLELSELFPSPAFRLCSLFTAVKGPGGIPMELQIKTRSMHDLAEYGAASHWAYKMDIVLPVVPRPNRVLPRVDRPVGPVGSIGAAAAAAVRDVRGYVGQPVLRIAKDKLRYGTVVGREDDGEAWHAGLKPIRVLIEEFASLPLWSLSAGILFFISLWAFQLSPSGTRLLVAIKLGGTFKGYPTRVPQYQVEANFLTFLHVHPPCLIPPYLV